MARFGTLSKAAEELFLTQPSVSARLQSLEKELGERLFERDQRGAVLTDAGSRFLRHAERILRILEESKEELDSLHRIDGGRLVIGAAPAVSTYFLPSLLARYAAFNERVEIAVRTGHTEEVLQMVLQDEAHIGLVRRVSHPAIDAYRVAVEELVLVAPPGHRFAELGEVSIADVAAEGLILFDRTTRWHELTWALFASQSVKPNVRLELDNVETAKRMVEVGLGVSLLPGTAVQREIRQGTLIGVPITDAPPVSREVLAIRRREAALPWFVQNFLLVLPGRGQELIGMAD